MPHACVILVEGQVLEGFLLEENINFQGRDQNVELPNKQKVDREMVVWPNLSVETPYEQEICVEMKPCNMSLSELFKAKEGVHTNGIELDKSNLYTKWKKIFENKVIRRANLTKFVKREVCTPPPKPPYILNINGELIGVIENVVSKTRPPLKPPRIHGIGDRERIGLEKEYLINSVKS